MWFNIYWLIVFSPLILAVIFCLIIANFNITKGEKIVDYFGSICGWLSADNNARALLFLLISFLLLIGCFIGGFGKPLLAQPIDGVKSELKSNDNLWRSLLCIVKNDNEAKISLASEKNDQPADHNQTYISWWWWIAMFAWFVWSFIYSLWSHHDEVVRMVKKYLHGRSSAIGSGGTIGKKVNANTTREDGNRGVRREWSMSKDLFVSLFSDIMVYVSAEMLKSIPRKFKP